MAKREIVKKDVAVKAASKVAKKDVMKKEAAAPVEKAEKKAPSTILTTTDISEHLATMFEIPKSHAKAYLAESIDMIGKHLKKGTKVRISGLGIFQVKKRAARKGRNPNTGDAIKIKASKRVAFAASRDLKAKL
jgi:DNA-binding protein HU-beta